MNIDLHCHPSQKTSFTKKVTPDYIEFDTKFGAGLISDESKLAGDILDSQSSIEQIKQGNHKYVFWAIIAFERAFLRSGAISQARKNMKTPELDSDFFDSLSSNEKTYYKVLLREWKMLELLVKQDPDLHLITNVDAPDNSKINVIPSIESFHSFIDHKAGSDPELPDPGILKRVKVFLTKHKLGYITLTHLLNNGMFSHCHATKLLGKREVIRQGWAPKFLSETGRTGLADDLLDLCVDQKVPIDIKHLSYVGRQSVYKKLSGLPKGSYKLLASHCGVTGRSMEDRLRDSMKRGDEDRPAIIYELKGSGQQWIMLRTPKKRSSSEFRNKVLKSVRFNPISINLYDEDIASILRLGGLIGVSLDQRILGKGGASFEFMMIEDYKALTHTHRINPETYLGTRAHWKDEDLTWDEYKAKWIAYESNWGNFSKQVVFPKSDHALELELNDQELKEASISKQKKRNHRFSKHVTQAILHIIKIGVKANISNPWKQICIGSDFDGLINAIDSCRDSSEFPMLKTDVLEHFRSLKSTSFFKKLNVPPENLADAVFGDNVKRFYGW